MQTTVNRRPQIDTDELKPARERSSPMRVVLKLEDSNQVISVPVTERLLIGRGDENTEPEINLDPFDSGKFGVSRQHAVFTYDGNALFVEDLNSTNGTRINGFRIDAGRPYRLHNGDELEFGRLRLSLRLVRVPA